MVVCRLHNTSTAGSRFVIGNNNTISGGSSIM